MKKTVRLLLILSGVAIVGHVLSGYFSTSSKSGTVHFSTFNVFQRMVHKEASDSLRMPQKGKNERHPSVVKNKPRGDMMLNNAGGHLSVRNVTNLTKSVFPPENAKIQQREGPKDKAASTKEGERTGDGLFNNRSAIAGANQQANLTSVKSPQKYLIYMCQGRQTCGGWADRQRGIVSAFILSLATGRKFGIAMTNPCNVSHYYVPNEVNWNIPSEELEGKTKTVINDVSSRAHLSTRLGNMDFNAEYPQDVIYIRTNNGRYKDALRGNPLYFPKLPHWARSKAAAPVFAKAWTTLMRPSDTFKTRLENYFRSINFYKRKKPFVCAHVRIGRSATIKSDIRALMNVSDIPFLWQFLDKYVKNGSLVFLATDNNEVRNLTRQRFGKNMTDSGGAIVHTDRERNNACAGFGDALLDQLVLVYCDVLVTSPGGFSLRAAHVRGTSENLYLFVKRKVSTLKLT